MKKGWLEQYDVPSYGKYQTGGKVAITPEEQYRGLNDQMYSAMSFPGTGSREFRGLDNGYPVKVTDSMGKSKILKGNNDRDVFTGTVHEQKIKNDWLQNY